MARKDRQGNPVEKKLSVARELPLQYNNEFPVGGPTAVEAVGIAFDVTRTVAEVTPGSAAEKAGLQAGDVFTQAQDRKSTRLNSSH